MPELRPPLRHRVRLAARRLGIDAHCYQRERDVDRIRVRLLHRLGVGIVIDGGANEGQWALGLRRSGYGGSIISFEPVQAAFTKLRAVASDDSGWHCIQAALGDIERRASMNVAGNSLSSSLLPMETAHIQAAPESAYMRTETVEVVRLDRIMSEFHRAGERLALKLDIQGYEASALSGAEGIMRDVHLIECELSVVQLYRGQALLHDLLATLRGLGFCLVCITEGMIDAASGRVLQVDGILARDDGLRV